MKLKFASIVFGLCFLFSFSVCRPAQNHTAEAELSPFLNHADNVAYTGIESCRECHADKYQTFIQTGMGQSFDSAGLKKTAANFKSVKPVYDKWFDLYYLPFVNNGEIFLKEYRLRGKDTIHSRIERIQYIVGSGHHTNSHMTIENGYVYQAPLTFYTQKGKWDLPPGFENGMNTRFNRKIGMECMSCHNAMPDFKNHSENRYTKLPHGISCERCHGPGELHVREMKKGNAVNTASQADYTIVNPRRLSWKRQIDICQRCHLQGNAVLKPGKDFTSYKPGMKLSETMDQFSPEYEDGEDFVMAAHAERFQKSKCFVAGVKGDLSKAEGKAEFTCISCHNPHVSVRHTNTLQFNATCTGCHSSAKQNLCTESENRQKSAAYNCVSCHMPASGTSDIPHVTVHDHYIRKPGNHLLQKPGRLKGLRCITSDSTDPATETEAYISYYEKFDANKLYLNKAYALSAALDSKKDAHFRILVHLFYVAGLYKEVIRLHGKGVPDAWTSYRIAKSYENDGQNARAEDMYAQAVEAAPENLDFKLQYAAFEIKLKRWKKAEQLLLAYNSLYSKTAETWAYLGLVYMQKAKPSDAVQCFNRALQLDPDLMLALQNLKVLYSLSGDKAALAKTEAAIAHSENLLAKRLNAGKGN